jgi:hypothetical protein
MKRCGACVRGRGSEEHRRVPAALFVLGVLVIRLSGEAKRRKLGSGLAYSVDRLVPAIKSSKARRDGGVLDDARPSGRRHVDLPAPGGSITASRP